MRAMKPWVDGCRVIEVITCAGPRLKAINIEIAEYFKDYVAPMSESASRANEIIRNMIAGAGDAKA